MRKSVEDKCYKTVHIPSIKYINAKPLSGTLDSIDLSVSDRFAKIVI